MLESVTVTVVSGPDIRGNDAIAVMLFDITKGV